MRLPVIVRLGSQEPFIPFSHHLRFRLGAKKSHVTKCYSETENIFRFAGSPITGIFTRHILQLQENGTLRAMRNRWWSGTAGGKRCTGSSSATDVSHRDGSFSIGALLAVLVIGCLVSLVLAVFECLWRVRCSTRNCGVTRFFFAFSGRK